MELFKILSKNKFNYWEKVITPIDAVLKNIENWTAQKLPGIKNVTFGDDLKSRLMFQEVYLKISELIERLPEEIEISNFTYSDGETKNIAENSVPVKVNPFKIARYYFDTRLYDPFYRELEQFDKLVKQSVIEFREANSLLKFRLENALRENENNSFSEKDFQGF